MAYIVFVALLWSVYVLRTSGAQAAFLRVWIPVFLTMPTMFWVNIPGLPDPNFAQAAAIPILLVLFIQQRDQMTMGVMEWLIASYMVVRVVNDYQGRGFSDAQNYAFYILTALIGPYLMGRYLIDSRRMDIAAARVIVGMFLIFFPMFVYELKAWVSPVFKIFGGFFPSAYSGLSIRWGIARTAGTFEHPILACVMVTAAYRLHRWLAWNGQWNGPQPGLLGSWQKLTASWKWPLQSQITFALVAMALMTISRGPWIGALAAALVVATGNRPNRKRALVLTLTLLLVLGVAGKTALDAYITPAAGEVLSGEAKTMLYRKEMVERYQAFLMERFWEGWGLTKVPKIAGMESVDNAFFLMALQHGVIAPALFAIIFLYAIASQLRFGLRTPPGQPPIGFTFSGIYLMCFIAFMTVYMGAQTEPLLFLFLGWGESIKRRPDIGFASAAKRSPFKRVLQ
jgi:hypothetical protein